MKRTFLLMTIIFALGACSDKEKEAEFIHAELTSNESEINNIIYRLYDLTDEEIAIVENSIK